MGYEHRVQAEKNIGRKLKAGEVVHHIDEDKQNNDPANLMVFKQRADHARLHKLPPNRREVLQLADGAYICRAVPSKKACAWCGELFTPTVTRKGCNAQKCCSKACSALARKQVSNKPPKEELESLLLAHSFLAIGKMFNVSDNAVRKWCKSYGLPFNRADVKKIRGQ